jgi:L,D-transpeptidase-like protein/putative peptidoglycan binding protein
LVRAALLGATLAFALVAAPSAEAVPQATKLTLGTPKHAPALGGKVDLTATLTAGGKPLAGKTVALMTGPQQLAAGPTDAKGRITFEVTVSGTSDVQATFTPAPPDVPAFAPASSNIVHLAPAVGLKLRLDGNLHAGRKAVGVPHELLVIRGTVAPYIAGRQVTIDIFKGPKRVKHKVRPLKPGAQGKGKFALSFKPADRGVYTVRAASSSASKRARVYVVRPSARQGDRGTAVRALQSRLAELGYLTAVNGRFNASTARAVLAFRKVNGYPRNTSAGAAVFSKLARGAGGFRVRFPSAGKHVEFDWSRQVVVLARGAKPDKIVHASSGKPSTPTVFGKFHFYSKSPGYNAKGMYFSNYFIGGYAIHGYPEVPNFAASHGCIRIPIASAIAVSRWISVGDTIYVYR